MFQTVVRMDGLRDLGLHSALAVAHLFLHQEVERSIVFVKEELKEMTSRPRNPD